MLEEEGSGAVEARSLDANFLNRFELLPVFALAFAFTFAGCGCERCACICICCG